MKIRVTKDDIGMGKPRDCGFCPIAYAVARELNIPLEKVRVSQVHVVLREDDGRFGAWALLPSSAQRFIGDFDKGLLDSAVPFEFELKELTR